MVVEKNMAVDQTIHDETRGAGHKPIILTHGLPSSLRLWDRMSQALVSRGYQTIALDLPGHGDSHKPIETGFYTADNFYGQYKEWIDHLTIGARPVLLGHSFGGYLSLRYALENQQKVRGLILINPFLSFTQMTGPNRLLFSYPPISKYLLKVTPFRLLKFFLWTGSLTIRNSRIGSFLSNSELYQVAVDFKRCSPNIARLPRTLGDITPRLADLHIPTLLIWGKRDETLSPSWYPGMTARLPNSTFQTINAGHNPHLSNFPEVYPAILEFLESLYPAE